VATLQINGIEQKINSAAREMDWLLKAGGFVVGVTQKDQTFNGGLKYFQDPLLVAKDFLSRMGIGGITLKPGYTTTANLTVNFGAFFNKGLAIAAGVWLAKEFLPSKLTRLAYNVAFDFALWYAIGRIFDDPISSAAQLGNVIPTANYGPNVRNGLPVATTGAGWLG
jgi:hypothetical protein